MWKDEYVSTFVPQFISSKQMNKKMDILFLKYNSSLSTKNTTPICKFSASVLTGINIPNVLKCLVAETKLDDDKCFISKMPDMFMIDSAIEPAIEPLSTRPTKYPPDLNTVIPVSATVDPNGFSFKNCLYDQFESVIPIISVAESAAEIKQRDIENKKNIVVLFNKDSANTMKTIVLTNPSEATLDVIENYTEYGFSKLFSIRSDIDTIHEFIKKMFHGIFFYNIKSLNAILESTANIVHASNASLNDTVAIKSEESVVLEFLKKSYIINDNVEHKLKASALCEIMIKNNIVTISSDKITSFKNRLSHYLKTAGLRKKRYNDGFYYYGIREKEIPIKCDNHYTEYSKSTRPNSSLLSSGDFTYRADDFSFKLTSTDLDVISTEHIYNQNNQIITNELTNQEKKLMNNHKSSSEIKTAPWNNCSLSIDTNTNDLMTLPPEKKIRTSWNDCDTNDLMTLAPERKIRAPDQIREDPPDQIGEDAPIKILLVSHQQCQAV